jgi:mRNA-degrading endonuclease RelE of RelBE toxin-antitoxin system
MQLTLEKLYGELEKLKKRIEFLESVLIEEEASEEEVRAIEEYQIKKEAGELEFISFDDALKELGIDEAEIREEIHKKSKKLDHSTRVKIFAHLKLLEEGKKVDVKKIKGFGNIFRLRIGDYRVKFTIEGEEIIVFDRDKRDKAY